MCSGCDGYCAFCLTCDACNCKCFCMGRMLVSSCRCMFVSCVHPMQGFRELCVLHDLQFVNAGRGCHRRPYGFDIGDHMDETYSKRVQPTRGWTVAAQRSTNCTHSSCPPQWGPVSTVFWAGRPSGPADWLALLLLKAGDVETNPGPKHTSTQVWICDICHREITRKQTSLRCNHSEH